MAETSLLGKITNWAGGGRNSRPSIKNQEYYRAVAQEDDRRILAQYNSLENLVIDQHEKLSNNLKTIAPEERDSYIADYTNGGYNSVAAFNKSMENASTRNGFGIEQIIGLYGPTDAGARIQNLVGGEDFQKYYGYGDGRTFDLSKSKVSYDEGGNATFVPFVNTMGKDGQPISAAATVDASRNVDNLNEGGVALANSKISTDVSFAKFDQTFDLVLTERMNKAGLSPDVLTVEDSRPTRNTSSIGEGVDFGSLVNTQSGTTETPPVETTPAGQGTTVDTNMPTTTAPTTTAPSIITNDSYTSLNIPLLNDAANITDNPLINKIIDVESSGNPDAVSDHGAKGLMQIKDATADDPGFGVTPAVRNADGSISSEENVRVGTDYFNALTEKYGGDTVLAAMAYNAGPGAIDKWIADGRDFSKLSSETQNYVGKVFGKDVQNQFKDGTYGATTPSSPRSDSDIMGVTGILNPNQNYTYSSMGKKEREDMMSSMSGAEVNNFIMNDEVPERFYDSSIKKVEKPTNLSSDTIFKDPRGGNTTGSITFKDGKYIYSPNVDADYGGGGYYGGLAADEINKQNIEITKEEAANAGFLIGAELAKAKKENETTIVKAEEEAGIKKVNNAFVTQLQTAAKNGNLEKLEELLNKGIEGSNLTTEGAELLQGLIEKRKSNLYSFDAAQISRIGVNFYAAIPAADRPQYLKAIGYFVNSGGKLDFAERELALDEAKVRNTAVSRNDEIFEENASVARTNVDKLQTDAEDLNSTDPEFTDKVSKSLDAQALVNAEVIELFKIDPRRATPILNKSVNAQSMVINKLLQNKADWKGKGPLNLIPWGDFFQFVGAAEDDPSPIDGQITSNIVAVDSDGNATTDPNKAQGIVHVKPGSSVAEQQGRIMYFGSLASGGTSKAFTRGSTVQSLRGLDTQIVQQIKQLGLLNSLRFEAASKG